MRHQYLLFASTLQGPTESRVAEACEHGATGVMHTVSYTVWTTALAFEKTNNRLNPMSRPEIVRMRSFPENGLAFSERTGQVARICFACEQRLFRTRVKHGG